MGVLPQSDTPVVPETQKVPKDFCNASGRTESFYNANETIRESLDAEYNGRRSRCVMMGFGSRRVFNSATIDVLGYSSLIRIHLKLRYQVYVHLAVFS